MGRFQLELIYLYFPPSFHLTVGCFCPLGLSLSDGRTVENKGKLILTVITVSLKLTWDTTTIEIQNVYVKTEVLFWTLVSIIHIERIT